MDVKYPSYMLLHNKHPKLSGLVQLIYLSLLCGLTWLSWVILTWALSPAFKLKCKLLGQESFESSTGLEVQGDFFTYIFTTKLGWLEQLRASQEYLFSPHGLSMWLAWVSSQHGSLGVVRLHTWCFSPE